MFAGDIKKTSSMKWVHSFPKSRKLNESDKKNYSQAVIQLYNPLYLNHVIIICKTVPIKSRQQFC